MPLDLPAADDITSEAQLREIYPPPQGIPVLKHLDRLDQHCRTFLARSPFAMIATADAEGDADASPRGGEPGFIKVYDDHTLLIPDAPGNRRIDTLRNVVSNPRIGLCSFVPHFGEVLRISGRARITRNEALRERLASFGRVPATVLVITVEDAFLHCAKAVMRSHLWQPEKWAPLDGMPSAAEIWRDHTGRNFKSREEIQVLLEESYTKRLY
jgi:PPOX class probable FMN-dependent enzyme